MTRLAPLLSAAAVLALGCTGATAQTAAGSFERAYGIDEPIALTVTTGSGSITVRGGPPGEVRVYGEIRVGRFGSRRSALDPDEIVARLEADPPIVVSGSTVEIGRIDDPDLRGNTSISYEIVVPAEASARLRTGSGRQRLSGLIGDVVAETGSGGIDVDTLSGTIGLRTGSGSIDAREIAGSVTARTGSGSVSIAQSGPGDVDATSGSGRIALRGVEGALRARAGSGRIEADGILSGPWDLETGSGSIVVRLPPDAVFDLDVQTGSGGITVDHDVVVRGRIRRNSLTGSVGGGGPPLTVRTGSGRVHIAQR